MTGAEVVAAHTSTELEQVEPSQREAAVTAYLSLARDQLAHAVEMSGQAAVAALKAEIATAAEATRQLGLSKEIQADVQEMLRRAEYALTKSTNRSSRQSAVGSEPVPAFVIRGTALWNAEHNVVRWTTEADLRDALAATWWFHGADVQTEVKVPDCGRIDILVCAGLSTMVIEVKRKISTTTEARQAFQQAHAYLSYLDASDSAVEDRQAVVTAGYYDPAATAMAERAYPDVLGASYSAAMSWPECRDTWFEHSLAIMAKTAARRRRTLDDLLAFARVAEMRRMHITEDVAEFEAAS